jgi:adenine-specific DNA-methyltransferase
MARNIDKKELAGKIAAVEGLSPEDKSALMDLLNARKKYGLVWEEKPEDVEIELADKLPVLKEVEEKRIVGESEDSPNHILIEGDNLHALTALQYTHAGKIDVIYIDPPYNTGNNDFVYNDRFIDKEDSYRHSKWLSFISKRLKIAKYLLKETGVILISIDDNEQAQLKLLCDEVFCENNLISIMPRITKSSGKTTNKIALNHDYLLIYTKDKNLAIIDGLDHNDKGFRFTDEFVDSRGKYKLNQTLDYDSLQYSKSLDYPIKLDGQDLYPGSNYEKYLERQKGKHNRADWAWRWSKKLYEFGLENGFIVLKHSRNGYRIYTKTYQKAKIVNSNGEYCVEYSERKKPLSSLDFTDKLFSNDNAKKTLDNVLKQSIFDYPKPISLISTFLMTNPNKSLTILDFFAGSGTTLHATISLNAEDGGDRQCIVVTNNENNICEEVTYERNRRIIQGYTNKKGEKVDGIKNNTLRYFKTDFVAREPSMKNKRKLVKASVDLLCIKEDCYKPVTDCTTEDVKVFETSEFYMIIGLTDDAIDDIISVIESTDKECKVYIFAPAAYPHTADFEEELSSADFARTKLCALPEAIYRAYQSVLREVDRKMSQTVVVEESEGEDNVDA